MRFEGLCRAKDLILVTSRVHDYTSILRSRCILGKRLKRALCVQASTISSHSRIGKFSTFTLSYQSYRFYRINQHSVTQRPGQISHSTKRNQFIRPVYIRAQGIILPISKIHLLSFCLTISQIHNAPIRKTRYGTPYALIEQGEPVSSGSKLTVEAPLSPAIPNNKQTYITHTRTQFFQPFFPSIPETSKD